MGSRKFGVWELHEFDPAKDPAEAYKAVIRYPCYGLLSDTVGKLVTSIKLIIQYHNSIRHRGK